MVQGGRLCRNWVGVVYGGFLAETVGFGVDERGGLSPWKRSRGRCSAFELPEGWWMLRKVAAQKGEKDQNIE